ncbi:MAG TPA: GNAT family N-acetyltransferase [Dehalococcoidia bacterium]|nr:GNAT family N-acetyltransferase [Dehalococcoidia bacterium]
MGNPAYIIRNYHPQDLDRLVRFRAEVENLGRTWGTSLPELTESLGRPNLPPENNLFIAELAGNIVGYADVAPELDIGRVVLGFLVHPEHGAKGLAAKLIDCATRRATELGAKAVHVNIPQDSVRVKRLLCKRGFRFVRRFLELRLDVSQARLPNISQLAPRCRHLQRGEEAELAQIQNRCFADTWGYNPNTTEDVIHRISLPHCSPEDVILACDADKPIGYCWTRTKLGGNMGKGCIYMLGVDPDHRGRGIGRQVLVAGLAYLKSKGLRVVELTVDSENKAACALYRSVGFESWTSSLWYEKALG